MECIFLQLVKSFVMRPSSLGGGRILRRTLSVCLSVRPVIINERHVAPPSELQWHTYTFRQAQRAAYRTAISAAQTCLLCFMCSCAKVIYIYLKAAVSMVLHLAVLLRICDYIVCYSLCMCADSEWIKTRWDELLCILLTFPIGEFCVTDIAVYLGNGAR